MTTSTLANTDAETVKGVFNAKAPLGSIGISGPKAAFFNFLDAGLMQEAVARGEGAVRASIRGRVAPTATYKIRL